MSDTNGVSLYLSALSSEPTLTQLQEYVLLAEESRGFSDQGILEKCLLLGEEVGELFKAVRKHHGIKIESTSRVGTIEEEMADVLIFLCAIANRVNVDLGKAFIEKEIKNSNRDWV